MLAYIFRGLVPYHHGREHDNVQVDVAVKEMRVLKEAEADCATLGIA